MIDQGKKESSSKVAAGIINPVTGRRVVKSWRIDELIPFAKQTYQEIEKVIDQSVYHEVNIIRTMPNIEADNLWSTRSAWPDLEGYMLIQPEVNAYKDKLQSVFGFGEIQHSARVDTILLLEQYKEYFVQNEMYLQEEFDFDAITLGEDKLSYKEYQAQKIIFCEGYQARSNPYFSYLPFELSKGEILIVKIPNASFLKIIKHKLFLVPLGNDLYWVGSSYDWDFEDDSTTEAGKENLIQRLEASINLPYEIIQHKAAVRPSTKDRRPFIGVHPEHPSLAIFNGMGTKGTSLSPFLANQFANFLLGEEELDPVVDINRCKKPSSND